MAIEGYSQGNRESGVIVTSFGQLLWKPRRLFIIALVHYLVLSTSLFYKTIMKEHTRKKVYTRMLNKGKWNRERGTLDEGWPENWKLSGQQYFHWPFKRGNGRNQESLNGNGDRKRAPFLLFGMTSFRYGTHARTYCEDFGAYRAGEMAYEFSSAVASNRPTETLASVISLAFVVYST